MARFHVEDTFEVPEKNLFVLVGSIIEGQVRMGMFVRFPVFAKSGIQFSIQSVESPTPQERAHVCLSIEQGPSIRSILLDLQLAGEILDVVLDPMAPGKPRPAGLLIH